MSETYDSAYNWIVLSGRCTWIRTNSLEKANEIAMYEVKMGRKTAQVFTLNIISEFTNGEIGVTKKIFKP